MSAAPTPDPVSPTSPARKIVRWGLALLLTTALLVWVELELGWRETLAAWADIPVSTLVLLALATLASYGLRAWRAYLYFGLHRGHPFSAYLRINLLHNALNNLLPMRLGEASFPLLMKRSFELPVLSTSAGLVWIRLMDLHWLALLLSLLGVILISPVFIVPALVLPLLPLLLARYASHLSGFLPRPLKSLSRMLAEHGPLTPRLGTQLYLLTALVWSLKLVVLMLVVQHFIAIPGLQGLLGIIFADLSSVLPIHGLAGAGTFEGAMVAALLPFGIAADTILLAAVNLHLYVLGVTLLSIPLALLIPEWRANGNAGSRATLHSETES